jgi:hypothetical protein
MPTHQEPIPLTPVDPATGEALVGPRSPSPVSVPPSRPLTPPNGSPQNGISSGQESPPPTQPSLLSPTLDGTEAERCNAFPEWLNGTNAVLTVLAAVIAYFGLVYSRDSTRLAEWTSKKDYMEYCASQVILP